MRARLRTLAVLLLMSVCLIGDVAITREAQAKGQNRWQVVESRRYNQRLARWRMLSHRRQIANRRLRQRRNAMFLNQRRRRSAYWRRNHPRAWSTWARRHRRGRINWRATHPRAWSIWARRHRNRGRGRNWTPGIPRGRARGWHRHRD